MHGPDPSDDQAGLEYIKEHFPTRDQLLQVQACVTDRTGYVFPPLPADFGPEYLMRTPPADSPPLTEEADDASFHCIFDLGLEDWFFPPWDHEAVRRAMSD